MSIKLIIRTACICLATVSFNADAALIGRLADSNGNFQAYYDTEANLTWLANAYPSYGRSLNSAKTWAENLDVAGITGWRLPNADPTCGIAYNCTNSEMGNLFYNVLGNTAGSLTNTGPFSNVSSEFYWSGTQYAAGSYGAWGFVMGEGRQTWLYGAYSYAAWAVQSGDISAVPVPTAAWLFGSGLLSLVGLARRNVYS